MRGNDSTDHRKKTPPLASGDPGFYLEPLLGSYCRTASFTARDKTPSAAPAKSEFVYFETYLDDPVARTWAVQKVVILRDGGKTQAHIHHICGKSSFLQALTLLADFERTGLSGNGTHLALVSEVQALGHKHFRFFAEREGYVFDGKGKPHPRPHRHALPAGVTFDAASIKSANENLARPEDEFHNSGTASRLPCTHFLFDRFNAAAPKRDAHGTLQDMRVLDVFDRFVMQIKSAHTHLSAYCAEYAQLGKGGLIDMAEESLDHALHSLRQLKAYGIDTADFESFTRQCKVTGYVLHAEGLYDLMHQGKGDFSQNEIQFKARVQQALDEMRHIDGSQDALDTLKAMIEQATKPEVPPSIAHFIDRYDTQRAAFRKTMAPPHTP